MNETDEIDESVPSSPVIGRSSNSCTSRANLDPNDDSACNKTGRQSKDEENMAKAVGRQRFNGDKGPVCSSEANAIPGTTLGGSKSPVVDCVRPLSPIIASQKKRPRSKNVIPTAEDIFELPQINDTELGKTGNDVDSIFKDTILDDIDADVPKISKPSLGIENLSDAAHHSAEVANSTAKPRTISVGSEELRPKAQKFIYTRTSLFADGQSRLKLVGSKNKNAKSKENVSRNKTSSSRSNNGKNTVDQEIANASSNTILLLDDSFDVVPNANGKNPGNFKYQEVVRKQAERQKLTGRSCKECETYYKGSGLSAEEVQKRMTSCSRHREKFANPNTPPTFWQLDFPPTPGQDEEEVIRKPKRRKKSPLTVMDEEESEEVSETNEKHVRSKRRRPLARRF